LKIYKTEKISISIFDNLNNEFDDHSCVINDDDDDDLINVHLKAD